MSGGSGVWPFLPGSQKSACSAQLAGTHTCCTHTCLKNAVNSPLFSKLHFLQFLLLVITYRTKILTVKISQCWHSSSPNFLNNGPKCESNNVGNSNVPQRSRKVNIHNWKRREKKMYAVVAKTYNTTKYLERDHIHEACITVNCWLFKFSASFVLASYCA